MNVLAATVVSFSTALSLSLFASAFVQASHAAAASEPGVAATAPAGTAQSAPAQRRPGG